MYEDLGDAYALPVEEQNVLLDDLMGLSNTTSSSATTTKSNKTQDTHKVKQDRDEVYHNLTKVVKNLLAENLASTNDPEDDIDDVDMETLNKPQR